MPTVPEAHAVPAGWYPDPQGAGLRYWDGGVWTERTLAPPVAPGTEGRNEPVATKGDWIGGVLLSLLIPLVGLIAGIVYVIRGGDRATCGWMCVGLSLGVTLLWVVAATLGGSDPDSLGVR